MGGYIVGLAAQKRFLSGQFGWDRLHPWFGALHHLHGQVRVPKIAYAISNPNAMVYRDEGLLKNLNRRPNINRLNPGREELHPQLFQDCD